LDEDLAQIDEIISTEEIKTVLRDMVNAKEVLFRIMYDIDLRFGDTIIKVEQLNTRLSKIEAKFGL